MIYKNFKKSIFVNMFTKSDVKGERCNNSRKVDIIDLGVSSLLQPPLFSLSL